MQMCKLVEFLLATSIYVSRIFIDAFALKHLRSHATLFSVVWLIFFFNFAMKFRLLVRLGNFMALKC